MRISFDRREVIEEGTVLHPTILSSHHFQEDLLRAETGTKEKGFNLTINTIHSDPRMKLSVLVLLLVIPASFAQQDLESKVFVFPKETDTAHVILRPTITRPLQKVSVCLRSYTDLSRPYTPFSLATPWKDNAFLIYLQPPNTFSVYINQEVTNFKTDSESLHWRHLCVIWDSNTGVVQLWINGKLYPRRVAMKGSSIAAETSIILGQDQDKFGGEFDAAHSLVGEIGDVHMWDYVLTPGDVQKVISGGLFGNVINWKSLVFEIKGEVLIQPKP